MPIVSRREFVALAGLATAIPSVLAGEPAATRQCFVGESGKRGDWPLVVGALTTTDPDHHEARISWLRRKLGYPRPLTYASTDRAKQAFAEAVIDYFADTHDLALATAIVSAASAPFHQTPDASYAAVHAGLLGQGPLTLHLPPRSANPRDSRLRAFLEVQPGYRLASGRMSANLLQMASFLAGCVYGEVTGVRHPLKRLLADRLKERLGVTALAKANHPRLTAIA